MPSKAFITGRVLGPDDTPLPGGRLVFELTGLDTDAVADAVRVPRQRVFTLTALSQMPAGAEVFKNTDGLLGTAYRLTALWVETDVTAGRTVTRSCRYEFPVLVRVGSADTYSIDDLIAQGAGPFTVGDIVYPTLATAVAAAQAGAVTATNAAASAVSSANVAGAQIYATAAAGIAAVATGAVFFVPLASGGLDIRQKTGASTSASIGQFLPPTQSVLDTTAGRLMRSGDFGLGAAAPTNVLDFNTNQPAGLYTFGGTTLNKPADPTFAGCAVRMSRISGVGAWLAVNVSGGPGAGVPRAHLKASSLTPDDWTGWAEIFTQRSAVGPVAQVAGVPTGALVERGVNASGSYSRFADGTQICWHELSAAAAINVGFLGGFRTAPQSWNYPAAFVAAPVVQGSPGNLNSMSIIANAAGPNGVTVCHTAVASQASAALIADLVAVGRWF